MLDTSAQYVLILLLFHCFIDIHRSRELILCLVRLYCLCANAVSLQLNHGRRDDLGGQALPVLEHQLCVLPPRGWLWCLRVRLLFRDQGPVAGRHGSAVHASPSMKRSRLQKNDGGVEVDSEETWPTLMFDESGLVVYRADFAVCTV